MEIVLVHLHKTVAFAVVVQILETAVGDVTTGLVNTNKQ